MANARYIFPLAAALAVTAAAACSNDYELADATPSVDAGAADVDTTAPLDATADAAISVDAADANVDASPPSAPAVGQSCATHATAPKLCVDFETTPPPTFEQDSATVAIESPGSNSMKALHVTAADPAEGGDAVSLGTAAPHVIWSFDLFVDGRPPRRHDRFAARDGSQLDHELHAGGAVRARRDQHRGVVPRVDENESSTVAVISTPASATGWRSILVDVDLARKTLRLSARLDGQTLLEGTGSFASSGASADEQLTIGAIVVADDSTTVVIDNWVANWQ